MSKLDKEVANKDNKIINNHKKQTIAVLIIVCFFSTRLYIIYDLQKLFSLIIVVTVPYPEPNQSC